MVASLSQQKSFQTFPGWCLQYVLVWLHVCCRWSLFIFLWGFCSWWREISWNLMLWTPFCSMGGTSWDSHLCVDKFSLWDDWCNRVQDVSSLWHRHLPRTLPCLHRKKSNSFVWQSCVWSNYRSSSHPFSNSVCSIYCGDSPWWHLICPCSNGSIVCGSQNYVLHRQHISNLQASTLCGN